MAYSFSSATTHVIEPNTKFFLDANIWLKILQPKNNPSHKEREYRLFFDKIISNNKVKIVVPSLIISEVINRILREVYYGKHIAKQKKADSSFVPTNDYYKNTYRKTEDFSIAYNLICDDIKNYHSSIELINDEFGTNIKFKHVMSNPPQGLDFNDYYYFRLCKLNKYYLVTDDKDFWIEDISIITLNDTLKNKNIAYLLDLKK